MAALNSPAALPLRRLEHLGSLLVHGSDAASYLQGQLSFDMNQLTSARLELAACNSPQGRVQAVLWMVKRGDGIALILPAALLDSTLQRLRKYVLRAKVAIESGRERFALYDATGSALVTASVLPETPGAHLEVGGTDDAASSAVSLIRWPGGTGTSGSPPVGGFAAPRVLMLAPAVLLPELGTAVIDPVAEHAWRLADLQAGLPRLHPQTQEAFVAQMLNVDLLGGINFEKGCYTGQEIIARTHFRGAVKRRMLRFRAECPPPAPATRVVTADGTHAGDVVDAIDTNGGCELLAVISLSRLDTPLALADLAGSSLTRLALPYEVA